MKLFNNFNVNKNLLKKPKNGGMPANDKKSIKKLRKKKLKFLNKENEFNNKKLSNLKKNNNKNNSKNSNK